MDCRHRPLLRPGPSFASPVGQERVSPGPLCRRLSRNGWSRSKLTPAKCGSSPPCSRRARRCRRRSICKQALHRVLEILGRHHGALRSTVVLLNDDTGEVEVEAAAGAITPGKRIRYRLGEGHHRPGRAERQTDRRAPRQPRAGVSEPRGRAAGARAAGAHLHLGADLTRKAARSARSASICATRPIATITGPSSSSASSAR